MTEKIEGIILEIIKHNDRHNVAIVYTRTHGRMAFLIPLGKTIKSRSKLSSFLLLAHVSGDVRIKPGKDIHNITNISSPHSWHTIYFNPVKSSLVFFLAEFLNRFLRQAPPDENIWNFIISSLQTLDTLPSSSIANFHISFLVGLLYLSGIMPLVENYDKGMIFDMQSGEFLYPDLKLNFKSRQTDSKFYGPNIVNESDSQFLPTLARINYRNMTRFHFSRSVRSEILDRLIQYFSFHLPIGGRLKSLDVLKEILA